MTTFTTTILMKDMFDETIELTCEYEPETMEILSSTPSLRFFNKKEMCDFIQDKFPGAHEISTIEPSIIYAFFGLYIKTNPYNNKAYETCQELCNNNDNT